MTTVLKSYWIKVPLTWLLVALMLQPQVNINGQQGPLYPVVLQHLINEGHRQRSVVTNIGVRMANPAPLLPENLLLWNLNSNRFLSASNFNLSMQGATQANWTFPGFPGGSVPEGNYLGVVLANGVTNAGGAMAGGTNRLSGEPLTFSFFRYAGDWNGDRDVDFWDNFAFQRTYGRSTPDALFDGAFDFDADGRVGELDLAWFNRNYFSLLPPRSAVFGTLANDTGNPWDNVTTDPTVAGIAHLVDTNAQAMASLEWQSAGVHPAARNVGASLRSDGTFWWTPAYLEQLLERPLTGGDYVLHLRIVEPSTEVSSSYDLPFRIPTDCSLDTNGWNFVISESKAAGAQGAGSVTFGNCELLLSEGDSFQVQAEKLITIRSNTPILSLTYRLPEFDATARERMRDAFEVALVDATGRPLTFTIQGSAGVVPASVTQPQVLPATPQALFNHSEGLEPFGAMGTGIIPSPRDPNQYTLAISTAELAEGSQARLIVRLVNNDFDRNSVVRLTELSQSAIPSPATLNTVDVAALSLLGKGGGVLAAGGLVSSNDCPPRGPTFGPAGAADPIATSVAYTSTNGDSLLDGSGRVVFTATADFHQGNFFNVNATNVLDQLQLNVDFVGHSVLWVPNDNDSVSRVDTRTGREVGRYWTGPVGFDGNPSRTTVDSQGACWVANRYRGTVVKIGLAENGGWIDRNGNGVLDTSTDSNRNGRIESNEILPWGEDECVLWEVLLVDGQEETFVPGAQAPAYPSHDWTSPGPRSIAIDARDNVWVGTFGTQKFYYIDGGTGRILQRVPVGPFDHRAYGAVMDQAGVIWSSSHDRGHVLRIDPSTQPPTVSKVQLGHFTYGMGLDSSNHLFVSGWDQSRLTKIDISVNPPRILWTKVYDELNQARGVVVTPGDQDVWVAVSGRNHVVRFNNEGEIKKVITGFTTPTGVTLDSSNRVWVTDVGSERIYRLNPVQGGIEFQKELPGTQGHYSYSDMTGEVRANTVQQGTWAEIVDSGRTGTVWGTVLADTVTPFGTSVEITVRAADDRSALARLPEIRVVAGQPLPEVKGQFLDFKVLLDTDVQAQTPVVKQVDVVSVIPPVLDIARVAPRMSPGSTVLFSGNAQASRPALNEQTTLENAILLTLLNGLPVESLDAGGNFFQTVVIRSGINRFEWSATDLFGQTTTRVVEVEGTCPDSAANLEVVSAGVEAVYARTSLNDWTRVTYADLGVRNARQTPIGLPLYVGITRISDPTVQLLSPDGVSADGVPYYDFSAAVNDGRLLPGAVSAFRTIAFRNPEARQFSYELVVLGQPNRPPQFDSVPRLEAIAGKSYNYDANANDPDGDVVTYQLLQGPSGMKFSTNTALIDWTPQSVDVGNHNVRISASDGKGGIAEQSYLLSVITQPSNRPPFFVSKSVTVARVTTNVMSEAKLVDLSKWAVVQYEFNVQPDANWVLSESNTVARQTVNADASILVSDFDLANTEIQGSWSIQSNDDDDFMGFVFGYQDAGHFYLFDWKQTDQNDGHSGFAERGMSVKRVSADSPLLEPDIWATVAADTSRVRLLYHNTLSYADFTEYQFRLRFYPGEFGITISQGTTVLAEIRLNDDTYSSGKFGFYNDSQAEVLYRGFTRKLLPVPTYVYDSDALDPDSDVLTYSVISGPTNLTINPSSGVVQWGPTAEQIGKHSVTLQVADGRGGTNYQAYEICVLAEDRLPTFQSQVLDLAVLEVDSAALVYDRSTLVVTGAVSVTVSNAGPGVLDQVISLSLFADRDRDGKFTKVTDSTLGRITISEPLIAGQAWIFSVPVSGLVDFAGAPVWAFVDSDGVINERDEENNRGRGVCVAPVVVGQFNPRLEWQRQTFSVFPDSRQVMMTPSVVDLDGDGMPEIILGTTASLGGGRVEVGVLRALRGDSGEEVFTVSDSNYAINTACSVAVGDIDSDGRPEIIACDSSGTRLMAFEHDGSFKWRSPQLESIDWGAPSIADLDHDGRPEIIIGRQVLNADGSLRWTGTGGRGVSAGPISLVADVDLDGEPDVLAGNTLYDRNGKIKWQNAGLPDGLCALGNFDADPYPEIVLVSSGNVWLLSHNGLVVWGPRAIPGGGGGGPPTVADYDGDGSPEIGVAGANRYVVFETDGKIKWESATVDASSSVTGSSVFDFDGDGQAEVVYRDEFFLRIYRGKDGFKLYEIPMSSCTWHEYVVVADVDADGNAEIVAVANQNCGKGPQSGVFVIGDLNDTWVSTRSIWNQHTYHIDNVNEDGTIPRYETNSWQSHNTYRLNQQTVPGGALSAPDLVPSLARIRQSAGSIGVLVRIGNGGTLHTAAGVSIAFYDGPPQAGGTSIGVAKTLTRLDPGAFEDVVFPLPSGRVVADLWIVADDNGAGRGEVRECVESNNSYQPRLAIPELNQVPRFTSVAVTNASEGVHYTYQVVAADPDAGDTVELSLSISPAGMAFDTATGLVSWTPSSSDQGLHLIQITATDSRGARNFQSYPLVVDDRLNGSPRFISSPPLRAEPNQTYSYSATAVDPEGSPLRYDLVVSPQGMIVETNLGAVLWRPLFGQIGVHDVILRASDTNGGVNLQSWQITVTAANTLPFVTSVAPSPAAAGRAWVYHLSAQDGDSASLTFQLGSNSPPGLALVSYPSNLHVATLTWTPANTDVGSNRLSVIIRDEQGGLLNHSFELVVLPSIANVLPHFVTQPRLRTRTSTPYGYVAKAIDANGDPVSLQLGSHPVGMVLTNDPQLAPDRSLIRWVPTVDQAGNHAVEVVARDGQSGGVVTQLFTLTVSASLTNAAPFIESNPVVSGTSGQPYEYDLAASDADADSLTWRLVQAPTGMSLDAVTGKLRWLPTVDHLGTNSVIVEVEDSLFATGRQAWQIEVGCVNRPPEITSVPGTQAQTGEEYLYVLRAVDPDGDTVQFSFADTNQIPFGMSLSNLVATGGGLRNGVGGALVRWTPLTNQVGAHQIRIRARDNRGGEDIQAYELYAANLRGNQAPVIVSTPQRGAIIGRPYTYRLIAKDADGDALTMLSLVPLPSGATFVPDPTTPNTALLTWSPTESQGGFREFVVGVKDPVGASAAQRFQVQVRPNLPPSITSTPRTNAVPDILYSYAVGATDPENDPIQYSLVQFPAGMRMNDLGYIQWSPTSAQLGGHAVEIRVTDSFGASGTQNFTVQVDADLEPPAIDLQLTQGSTNSLTGEWSAELGQTVKIRVKATDNVGVASRALLLGTNSIPLDESFEGSILVERGGVFRLTGVAVDLANNTNTTARTIQFRDPRATNHVYVKILSPAYDSVLTAPTKITATITNDTDILSYSWGYAIAADVNPSAISITDPAFTIVGTSNLDLGIKSLTNIVVGTFDPTLLNNDSYVIVVAATDANANIWTEPLPVSVEGNLKFGEFRLEFTDLAIPVAGIPIQVKRVYDSRLAKRSGDFGHGWCLGIQDAMIRESLSPDGYLRPNAKVNLTGPDGRRLGFQFTPDPFGGWIGGVMWRPRFTAEPGIYDRLEIPPGDISYPEGGGFAGIAAILGGPWNPSTYFLTTKEGVRYDYEQEHGLQQVTDRNGNRLVYTRDGIFHYNSGSNVSDQSVRFVRDGLGRIAQIIDPAGKALRYAYDGRGDLASFADQMTNTTRYAYDTRPAHFLTNIVDFLGRNALTAEFEKGTGKLVALYDAMGNPMRQAFDLETKAATFTDPNGNTILAQYDDRGNETVRGIQGVYTNYLAYDANNNEILRRDALGFVTTRAYDARGNLTKITDALTNVTTITYNDMNQPTSVTDGLGNSTQFRYDIRGEVTNVINALGRGATFARDVQGRVASVTDFNGYTTHYDYAGGCSCGKPGRVINPDGTERSFEYNSRGQTVRQTDELGRSTISSYDDGGRLLSTRDPDGHSTIYSYAGPLMISETDPLGRTVRYGYDARNRQIAITNASGKSVRFEYDNLGNRTSSTDPMGNVTRFYYDAANRVTHQVDAWGRTNAFTYDATGNRIATIDRNGRRRTFAYDGMSRQTGEFWWEGTNMVRMFAYSFDAVGVMTSVSDAAGRLDFSFDSLNRLKQTTQSGVAGLADFSLSYRYDGLGNAVSVTDNWGVQVTSDYDARNRLSRRVWQGGELPGASIRFGYDAAGNRTNALRFADASSTQLLGQSRYAFNALGIVTDIIHANATDGRIAEYHYQRDFAQQIVGRTVNSILSNYGYDVTGQLTNALYSAGQADESYRYDDNGNLRGGGYLVTTNNQIVADGTNHYTYDAEGSLIARTNLLSGATTTYAYDHRNRLIDVRDSDPAGKVTQTVEFTYDALNRRIARSRNGITNWFLFSGENVWADIDAIGQVSARYMLGSRIDEMLARYWPAKGIHWYLTDNIGTVHDLSDSSGAVINHITYDSFGRVLGQRAADLGDRFLFTAREYDAAVGLFFYRARYYDPSIGRFISQDPLGLESGDLNLYRYVGNHPLNAKDPTGTLSLIENAMLIGFVTGALLAPVFDMVCKWKLNQTGDITVTRELKKFVLGGLLGAAIGGLIAYATLHIMVATVWAEGTLSGVAFYGALHFFSKSQQYIKLPSLGLGFLGLKVFYWEGCDFLEIVSGGF